MLAYCELPSSFRASKTRYTTKRVVSLAAGDISGRADTLSLMKSSSAW